MLRLLQTYIFNQNSKLCIITNDNQCIIYKRYESFRNYHVKILQNREREIFYKEILESNMQKFLENKNKSPLVNVYLSQLECVGKSYVIKNLSKNDNIRNFIQIPINTKKIDIDFFVSKLIEGENLSHSDDFNKVIYHINVSSDAGKDVNSIMFQLLILKY